MSQDRPPLPPDVKLALRQEAVFGCCRCGFPVYDHHHITPYEVEHHFRTEDMMILCPNCHRMATDGVLSESEQRFMKQNPFNSQQGYASGLLAINQTDLVVTGGGIDFVGGRSILSVNGQSLLALGRNANGTLSLSATLYDDCDRLLAEIVDNEWVASDSLIWDLESRFKRIKIRQGDRRIALDVDARDYPVRVKADLWRYGYHINLNQLGIKLRGPITKNVTLKNLCLVNLAINVDTTTNGLSLQPTSSMGKGVIISEADHEKRIRDGVSAYHQTDAI